MPRECLPEFLLVFCIFAVHLHAQPTIANGSFEEPNIGACPAITHPESGPWVFSSNAAVLATGCKVGFYPPDAPGNTGHHVGLLHANAKAGKTTSIGQRLDGFVAGHAYQISFFAAGRSYSPTCHLSCGPLTFSVAVNEVDILDIVDPPSTFQTFRTNPFTASGSVALNFIGAIPDDTDRAAFIDGVTIEDMGPASAISSLVTPPAVWVDTKNPVALTPSVASAVITRTIPSQMVECEGRKCAGLWEFNGNRKGMVNWPDGGRGDLTISQFDSELVKIHRKDDNGFLADYSGIIAGNSITGEVIWHFQDGRVLKGKWSAMFGEAIGSELAAGRQRDAIRGLLGEFGSDDPEWKRKGFASEEAYETNQYNCHTGKGICHD